MLRAARIILFTLFTSVSNPLAQKATTTPKTVPFGCRLSGVAVLNFVETQINHIKTGT
jgi:hypothetical protein